MRAGSPLQVLLSGQTRPSERMLSRLSKDSKAIWLQLAVKNQDREKAGSYSKGILGWRRRSIQSPCAERRATAKASGLNGVLYALETMKHAHTRIQSIHISLVVMAVFIDYVFFSYFCKDHCCPVKVPDDYYKV